MALTFLMTSGVQEYQAWLEKPGGMGIMGLFPKIKISVGPLRNPDGGSQEATNLRVINF